MAARLPKAEEEFEDAQRGGARIEFRDDFFSRRIQKRRIKRAFVHRELAVQNNLGLLRKVRRDFTLEPTEDEEPDAPSKCFRGRGVSVGDRAREFSLEFGTRTEETWIEKFELTPEIGETILNRSAAESDPRSCAKAMGGARDLRVGILDRLGFVSTTRSHSTASKTSDSSRRSP